MGKMSFVEWLRKELKRDELCEPSLPAQLAVDYLCNYILGEDWYRAMPMHTEQVNVEIVHAILMKHSQRYRKEYKKAVRELVKHEDALDLIQKLEAENAELKRERDAAVRDCACFPCYTCKERENRDNCFQCECGFAASRRSHHEWRGPCEENGGQKEEE